MQQKRIEANFIGLAIRNNRNGSYSYYVSNTYGMVLLVGQPPASNCGALVTSFGVIMQYKLLVLLISFGYQISFIYFELERNL